jgi:chromosome segregation ATPase
MDIYDIKQENAQLKEKIETLSRENEEFLTSLEAASKYETMYNEQIIENEKLSDEIYQLKLSQAERKSADLSNKQMLDEMAALEEKYAKKLKRADSEKMDLIEEYENKISSINDSITQLELEKQELEYQIHSQQDSNLTEINRLKGKLKELTSQYDNLLHHSEEQLNACNTALNDKDNEIQNLKEQVERYQQDSREATDKLEGETMKLQYKISQLKSEREEKNLELKKLMSCYNDTSAELEYQKELVKELHKKLNLAYSSGQELSHDLLEHLKEVIQQDMSSFFEDVSNQMEFMTYSLENSETKLGELQVTALKTIKQTQRSQDLFTTIKQREQAYSNLLSQHKQLEKLYSDHKLKYDHDVQELIEEYEEKIHYNQAHIDVLTSQLTQAEKALSDQISITKQRESTQQAEDSGSEVIPIGESPLISPMKRKSLIRRSLISLSDEEHIDITPIQIPESSKTASPTSTMRYDQSLESASLYDSENGRLFVTINRLQEENHELEDTIQRQNDQMQLLRDEIRNLRGHITNSSESIADPITIKNMVSNLISSLPELPSDSESAIHSLMTILSFDANEKEKCESLRKSRKIVEKVKKGGLKKLFERKKKN